MTDIIQMKSNSDRAAEISRATTRPPRRLLDMAQVCEIVGLGKDAVLKKLVHPGLLRPLHFGGRLVRYDNHELFDAIDELEAQRDAAVARGERVGAVRRPGVDKPLPLFGKAPEPPALVAKPPPRVKKRRLRPVKRQR